MAVPSQGLKQVEQGCPPPVPRSFAGHANRLKKRATLPRVCGFDGQSPLSQRVPTHESGAQFERVRSLPFGRDL